jgi:hypothetical protein
MRACQTSGDLPVAAVVHAFVVKRPATGVVTSAHAVRELILTSRGVHRCFRRQVEEHSAAYKGDREEKLPCHGRTSWKGERATLNPNLSTRLNLPFFQSVMRACGNRSRDLMHLRRNGGQTNLILDSTAVTVMPTYFRRRQHEQSPLVA